MLSVLVLALGLLSDAPQPPPQAQGCPVKDSLSVEFFDPATQATIPGHWGVGDLDCHWVVVDHAEHETYRVRIRHDRLRGVQPTSRGVASLAPDEDAATTGATRTWSATLRPLVLNATADFEVVLALDQVTRDLAQPSGGDPNSEADVAPSTAVEAATIPDSVVVTLRIYLVRVPSPDLQTAPHPSCVRGGACLPEEGGYIEVQLGGRNLGELDPTANVEATWDGGGAVTVRLETDGGTPRVVLPPGIPGDTAVKFRFPTRRVVCTSRDASCSDTVEIERFVERIQRVGDEVVFRSNAADGHPVVLIGQRLPVTFSDGPSLRPRSYLIGSTEGAAPSDERAFAVFDLPSCANGAASCRSGTGWLTGLRQTPEVRVLNTAPRVRGFFGDTAKFYTYLRVEAHPRVDRVQVLHDDRSYTSSAVRPLETVRLVIEGHNLGLYDECVVPPTQGTITGTDRPARGTLVASLEVAATAQGRMPIRLTSKLTTDTTLWLDVQAPQKPAPLREFVTFRYKRNRSNLVGLRDPGDTVSNIAAASLLYSPSIQHAELAFDPSGIDAPNRRFGPQYLVVTAFLRAPGGEVLRRDSVRVVVVPPEGNYRVLPGYSQVTQLRLDDLLGDLPRYGRFGSVAGLAIRHDSIRYEAPAATARTVELRNSNRWRVVPHAAVLGGVLYLGKFTVTERTAVPLKNGSPSDSTISHATRGDVRFDALSIAGAAGIDWTRLRYDGRPSLLRGRVGLAVLESPYSDRRDLGVSVSYPLELFDLRGGAALGVSVGVMRLVRDSRWLWLLAPGFTIPVPSGGAQ